MKEIGYSRDTVGEVAHALWKEIENVITDIVRRYQNRHHKYWILLALKPSLVAVKGKPALILVPVVCGCQPPDMASTIVLEVDNEKGTLEGKVHDMDVPLPYERMAGIDTRKTKIGTQSPTLGQFYRF